MVQFFMILLTLFVALVIQVLDDFLSQRGVVSLLHGGLLGYGQIFIAKKLLEWGGGSLGWVAVLLVAACAMAVSAFKIKNTWTRWVCSFNFGIFVGILYGGFDLI